MSEHVSPFEQAVFQTLLPQLEAEGFHVFVHPSKTMLPPFMKVYRPDAIAYKGDRKLAIEVVGDTPGLDLKAQRLVELFTSHPEWELRFVHASPRQRENAIPVTSKENIEASLQQIESSLDIMGSSAALLYGWAVFEAAARSLTQEALDKGRASSSLLEKIASEGYITPDEADALRRTNRIRNEIAHGRLDLKPDLSEVKSLLRVTRTLLALSN